MTTSTSGEDAKDLSYTAVQTDEKHEDRRYEKTKLLNIALLGVVFMTTASRTPISIQKTVLYSAKQPNTTGHVEGFTGDGYVANSLLYASFAAANFLAPWVISLTGPKHAMLLGGLGYTAYAAQLLHLADPLLYTCALLNGLGASLLWTGQGNFLSINTSASSSARDAGLFWALYQLSGVLGNLAVYLLFSGTELISTAVRLRTAATFTALCVLGLAVILAFRPTPWHQPATSAVSSPARSLVSCVRLLGSGPMLRLSLAFLYTGLEISYWAGVLPACVSFTRALGPGRKGMMGLASILVSCGSMAGGLLLILCKQVVTRRGRTPVVMLGLATHLAAYTLSLVSLPHLSPLGDTQQPALAPAWCGLATILATATLMGLGDAAFNTQVISLYTDNSAEAFALVKLVQSVGVSAGFAVSTRVGLYWQLVVLALAAAAGAAGFTIVEKQTRKTSDNKEIPEC